MGGLTNGGRRRIAEGKYLMGGGADGRRVADGGGCWQRRGDEHSSQWRASA